MPGGNPRGATLGEGAPVFDMPEDAFRDVVDLNLVGTLLASQVFGAAMTSGAIAEVSSMAAARAITRVVGYAAAKGAVENLTQLLAVELARPSGSTPSRRASSSAGRTAGCWSTSATSSPPGRLNIDRTPRWRFREPRS
jgi:hypothetical protein